MLKEGTVRAVGLMSGTSLDGIDAAEIVTDGHRLIEVGATAYRPYTESERAVLRAGLGQGDQRCRTVFDVVSTSAVFEAAAGYT